MVVLWFAVGKDQVSAGCYGEVGDKDVVGPLVHKVERTGLVPGRWADECIRIRKEVGDLSERRGECLVMIHRVHVACLADLGEIQHAASSGARSYVAYHTGEE